MDSFTSAEFEYLASQRLGRLATVDSRGTPQNSPVGFSIGADGTVRVRGWNLGASRKFRNVAGHGRASLVVDDIRSTDPWQVHSVEIRGAADALTDVDPPESWLSREEIRLRPERIISWGLEADQDEVA